MSTREDSPNKYIIWFSRLVAIFFVAWLINLSKFVIIACSILVFASGVLRIWKPHIFCFSEKLLFSDKRTDNFRICSEMAWGILLLLISVIMIMSYRHNTLLYAYIVALTVNVFVSIRYAIWIIYYSREQKWIAKAYAWILFFEGLIFAGLGIGFFSAFLHSPYANETY